MEWWMKAASCLGACSGLAYGIHCYNDHYRQRGVEHPLTVWLRSGLTDEAEDRKKRIMDIAEQSRLAEGRLLRLHRTLPRRAADAIVTPIASRPELLPDTVWKSDFTEQK